MKEMTTISEIDLQSYSPNQVFFCPEESNFYSQCIEKLVLNQCSASDSIVEFGAGEGSPVIRCLLKSDFKGLIQGYELNYESYQQALFRTKKYSLNHQYIIHNKCFFQYADENAKCLIANPPYLPAPDNNLYMPTLHGGVDGATITNQLLGLNYENVLLMISSYSNPVEIVEYGLEQGYQINDFMISPLQFGYYSCEPKVKKTIADLRQNHKAFYSQDIYLLAGVLFSKKMTSYNISSEFLRIITAL